jgi:uncharacterized RDD family membrane protein YckC
MPIFPVSTTDSILSPPARTGAASPKAMAYAGFRIRLAAEVLDQMMVLSLAVPAGYLIACGMGFNGTALQDKFLTLVPFLDFLINGCYSTFLVGRHGATLGKMAAKIIVVNPDGSKLSYGIAFLRFLVKLCISENLTFCIGFIMVCWDEEKRALHDRICATRVIRRPPGPMEL